MVNVSIGPSFLGVTGFVISKLYGAFLTGTYKTPFFSTGYTFLIVIGIKCSPLTLMTVVIGAVLLVWFTGLKSFLFSFGITFKGI